MVSLSKPHVFIIYFIVTVFLDFRLRIWSPARRHMHITLSHLGTTSCYTEVTTDAWTTTKKRTVHKTHISSLHDGNTSVPHDGIRLLTWFSSLYEGNVSLYNIV